MDHILDDIKFSTVEFINKLLPNPNSLTNSNGKIIQNILTNLKFQIEKVDSDLQGLVRNQIQLNIPHKEVSSLGPNLSELVTKVDGVQKRAIQSEATVGEISKDIRALDYAKRNLTTCITFSRRLQMVITAVEQLKHHAANKQYREAGQLIQAVEQLFSHFQNFNNLKVIKELEKTIKNLKESLIKEILSQFQSSFNGLGKLAYPSEPLSEANTILDLIDINARKNLIVWYTDLQLQDYLSIFRGDDEVGALDNTSRRFAWLKRWFQMFDAEHQSIFPEEWHVDYSLAKKFCEVTHQDLTVVLENTASQNVNMIIQSMQLTVAFEHQLDKRYSHLLQSKSDSFVNTISHCFIPYLKLYLKKDNDNLREMIDQYKTQPLVADPEASIPVLGSSTKLFLFYSETLTTLSKATTHQPLLELAQLLAKWLQIYCDSILFNKLPNIEANNYQLVNMDDDIKTLCLMLNTSQYCLETLQSFLQRLDQLIHPSLKGQLHFTQQENSLQRVIDQILIKLGKLTDKSIEPIFNILPQQNWERIQTEIPIIEDLKLELGKTFDIIKLSIYRKKYLELYLVNYPELLFNRYLETCLKLKRIINSNTNVFKKTGEELRKTYLELVKNLNVYSNIQSFEEKLNEHFKKEWLLFYDLIEIKIPDNLDPEDEGASELVADWLDKFLLWIPDGSISKFIKVMQIKGIPKHSQAPFREKLAERVPSKSSSLSIAVTAPTANDSAAKDSDLTGANKLMQSPPTNYSQSKLNQNFQNFFKGMSLRREPSNQSSHSNNN